MEKYIIANPFPAGFSNILMSYEIIFACAHITGRSVILPPTSWCVLIDDKNSEKQTWQNIWDVCDKNYAMSEFKIYDLLDFSDFKNILQELTNTDQYSWTRNDVLDSFVELSTIVDSSDFYYNRDFIDERFTENRKGVDINFSEKYIKIGGFGHYWYNVYAKTPQSRNELKRKVNQSLRYKQKYFDLARKILSKVNNYNAIHVRSPWQLNFDNYSDVIQYKDRPEVLLHQVRKLFDSKKPLYVSTDITSKAFFDCIKKEYTIFFIDDLDLVDLIPIERIVIDQIICSDADIFFGTYYSTFTKRINIMRGLSNKQTSDYMGFNKIIEVPDFYHDAIPWNKNKFSHWDWFRSSHSQWIME